MSDRFSTDLVSSVGLSDSRFPETKEEVALVEDALAREMQNMSLEEQEIALFEVHGINGEYPEDPELVQSKLKDMEVEISKITCKDAFDLARSMNNDFITEYYLAFLRSARFDAKLAAEKIVMHFDVKRQLFGSGEILARDVRQSDLNAKDLEYLHKGIMQICPLSDSSGRRVISLFPVQEGETICRDVCAKNRAIFYYGSVGLRLEDIQKSGIVWVMLNYENSAGPFECMEMVYNVEKSLPARIAGGHYCYTDEKFRTHVLGFRAFNSKLDRVRMREHQGTPEEIDFALQTYGIPTHALPTRKHNSGATAYYKEWLETQRLKEERELDSINQKPSAITSSTDCSITVPERFDVLLGKTGQAREHTGNRRAALLCEMYFEIYEKATKSQKTTVAEKVISIIRESGGRFLKRGPDTLWVEADDIEARNKISHVFRYLRCKAQTEDDCQYDSDQTESGRLSRAAVEAAKRISPMESPYDSESCAQSRSTQQRRKVEISVPC